MKRTSGREPRKNCERQAPRTLSPRTENFVTVGRPENTTQPKGEPSAASCWHMGVRCNFPALGRRRPRRGKQTCLPNGAKIPEVPCVRLNNMKKRVETAKLDTKRKLSRALEPGEGWLFSATPSGIRQAKNETSNILQQDAPRNARQEPATWTVEGAKPRARRVHPVRTRSDHLTRSAGTLAHASLRRERLLYRTPYRPANEERGNRVASCNERNE